MDSTRNNPSLPVAAGDTLSEAELASVTGGAVSELANIDLQNQLRAEQRTFQTISNVLKMLHDTAMA